MPFHCHHIMLSLFLHNLIFYVLVIIIHQLDCINAFSHHHQKELKIAFVTGNEMKATEMQLILESHGGAAAQGICSLRVLQVDLPEIQEVSTQAIAKNKALLGAQLAGGPCVVEDTSLQFHALGGMPGPYIKWFQESLKSEGLWNILAAYEDKTATAVCTLAFCPYPHADPVLFTGITTGTIVAPVEGRGFGWDSIFVPKDSDIPFSQMSTSQKNELSHRGKAVRAWADWLSVNKNELYERQSGRPAIGHKGLDFKTSFAEE
jgi:inosine triphosphate pyrophosphatase